MITIPEITETPAMLVDPTHKEVGSITSYLVLNAIRIDIAKKQLEGYYIRFNNIVIDIYKDGKLSQWPKGFFDLNMIQLSKLFRIQYEQYKDEKNNNKK